MNLWFKRVGAEIRGMRKGIGTVKEDVGFLKGEVTTVREDLGAFKAETGRRFDALDSKTDTLIAEIRGSRN